MDEKNLGREWSSLVTLFDDPDDDEYDGIFGREDDDELPRVRVTISRDAAGLGLATSSEHVKEESPPVDPNLGSSVFEGY